jgi:hypothetical protein
MVQLCAVYYALGRKGPLEMRNVQVGRALVNETMQIARQGPIQNNLTMFSAFDVLNCPRIMMSGESTFEKIKKSKEKN